MEKFLWFCKGMLFGMKRGLQWYIHTIKYESKWYILTLIVDLVLLPLKLLIVIPIAWFRPESLANSNFGEQVYEELEREDF